MFSVTKDARDLKQATIAQPNHRGTGPSLVLFLEAGDDRRAWSSGIIGDRDFAPYRCVEGDRQAVREISRNARPPLNATQ
jgi:hypothetical protein